MKNLRILFIMPTLLVCCLQTYSQHEEPAIATISYHFTHVNDTNNRSHPIESEMILRLGRTSSKYTNADVENQIKSAQNVSDNISSGPVRVVTGMPMAVVSSNALNTDEVFQIPKENKLIRTATLGIKDYVIENALPKIEWKIENETRLIGQYNCQKAVGDFAGRTYIAWFSDELPFRNGPWKLWGLPGLILEAKDTKNEVSFLFKEITKATAEDKIFSDRQRPVKVSGETFERAKRIFEQSPSATTMAQLGNNKQNVQTYYHDKSGKLLEGDEATAAIKKERNKENNPIELTKTKL